MGEAAASGGGVLGDLELHAQLCGRDGLAVYNGRTSDGDDVLVVHLGDEPPPGSKAAFERMREHGSHGGLLIDRSDDQTIVAKPPGMGTFAHLPALNWPLQKRLEAFKKVVSLVEAFHAQEIAVGSLHPDFILLDDDLSPVLLGPRFAPYDEIYGAPESRYSTSIQLRADIYSLGRLLHFVLVGEDPAELFVDPAELLDLISYPAGLSRTIRKGIRLRPEDRYASVTGFARDLDRYGRYDEVGLAHPNVEEENLGGLSFRPPPQTVEPSKERTGDSTVIDQIADATEKLQEIKPFRLRQSTRAILLVLGLLSVAAAFAVNYARGDTEWIRGALCAAAGLVGFALFNPGIEGEQRLRTLFAIFAAAAMWASNAPVFVEYLADRAGLKAPDPQTRVESLKSQMNDHGETRFQGVDLSGAELKNQMFFVADMQDAILEGANLTEATFFGANLDGVRFRGAKLHGAKFTKSPVDGALGFEEAECDEFTELPKGWSCPEGHPRKKPAEKTPKKGAKKPPKKG